MSGLNAILPAFMQTKKEGGSSLTHPLATAGQHPGDREYEEAKSRGDGKGTEGYGIADSSTSSGAHEGYTRDPNDPSVSTGAVGALGSQQPEGQDEIGSGRQAENDMSGRYADDNMGSGRRAEDIAGARQDYVADREAQQQREMDSRQPATGLEQQDPYLAGAQAGGLLDKEDIRRMDRESGTGASAGGLQRDAAPQIGGDPESGFTSQQVPDTMGSAYGQQPSYSSNEAPYNSTGGQGMQTLNAAQINDQYGSSGTADRDMENAGSYAGGNVSGSDPSYSSGMTGGQMEGSGSSTGRYSGQTGEGLIHGHHTTRIGEALDPHIGQQ